jgi:hypothetical protein
MHIKLRDYFLWQRSCFHNTYTAENVLCVLQVAIFIINLSRVPVSYGAKERIVRQDVPIQL